MHSLKPRLNTELVFKLWKLWILSIFTASFYFFLRSKCVKVVVHLASKTYFCAVK